MKVVLTLTEYQARLLERLMDIGLARLLDRSDYAWGQTLRSLVHEAIERAAEEDADGRT